MSGDRILRDGLLMLVIMNPFAQMLYLSQLMNETSPREFGRILLQATIITFAICLGCALLGTLILFTLFQVTLPAMRVFGGLINLHLAYSYIMKGPAGVKLFSGNITELAQQIAMPVMVGAGVVWVSMRIGEVHPPPITAAIIAAVLVINGGLVHGYQMIFKRSTGRVEQALLKYFGVAMRFNALLIGALSVQMILGGAEQFIAMEN